MPCRTAVYNIGGDLLAGARFPQQQHGEILPSGHPQHMQGFLHARQVFQLQISRVMAPRSGLFPSTARFPVFTEQIDKREHPCAVYLLKTSFPLRHNAEHGKLSVREGVAEKKNGKTSARQGVAQQRDSDGVIVLVADAHHGPVRHGRSGPEIFPLIGAGQNIPASHLGIHMQPPLLLDIPWFGNQQEGNGKERTQHAEQIFQTAPAVARRPERMPDIVAGAENLLQFVLRALRRVKVCFHGLPLYSQQAY